MFMDDLPDVDDARTLLALFALGLAELLAELLLIRYRWDLVRIEAFVLAILLILAALKSL